MKSINISYTSMTGNNYLTMYFTAIKTFSNYKAVEFRYKQNFECLI